MNKIYLQTSLSEANTASPAGICIVSSDGAILENLSYNAKHMYEPAAKALSDYLDKYGPKELEVITSHYALYGMFELAWLKNWQSKDFRNSRNKTVDNVEFLKNLYQHSQDKTIKVTLLPDTKKKPKSKLADAMAQALALSLYFKEEIYTND